jgi:hypothetical protein
LYGDQAVTKSDARLTSGRSYSALPHIPGGISSNAAGPIASTAAHAAFWLNRRLRSRSRSERAALVFWRLTLHEIL